MSRHCGRLLLALLLFTQAASAGQQSCQRKIELAPNQKATIATTVQNDLNVFSSQAVEVQGSVTTDDGSNRLNAVWLLISDLFRWGKNEDLEGPFGPIIQFHERVSFWAKGMAEIRVQATNSPTHLCLCTLDQVAATDIGYPKRVKQCMALVRSGS